MTKASERLVAYGFLKEGAKPIIKLGDHSVKLKGSKPAEILAHIKELKKDDKYSPSMVDAALEKIADHERLENVKDQIIISSYPKPLSTYQAHLESYQKSVEHYYYWALDFLGVLGFVTVDKVTDVFTAAEQSSFYGAGAQRLGLAQDKAGQYLATIGKMTKDMFSLVREIRWIDERLEIYRAAYGHDDKGKRDKKKKPLESAEVTLKGLWVDLVDGVVGGQRTGSNLFTMASQLQFTALPDLFFGIHPRNVDEVDEIVDKEAKGFNKQVRLALKRKLTSFLAWKKATYDEIQSRRTFTINYLRQHYQTIQMYVQWVKPYIKRIERMSTVESLLDAPRLVGAFESTMVEIEILARMKAKKGKDEWTVLLINFEYHTKPGMQYSADGGYHRGPLHIGNTRITWRSYGWNTKQIESYIAMRRMEDLAILTSVDNSLKAAMDQLGEDILKYLEEAEHGKKEEKKKEKPSHVGDALEPFTALGAGFKEIFGALIPELPKSKGGGKSKKRSSGHGPGAGTAMLRAWLHYNVFKKNFGMLSW